jgi:hypothetical protein
MIQKNCTALPYGTVTDLGDRLILDTSVAEGKFLILQVTPLR